MNDRDRANERDHIADAGKMVEPTDSEMLDWIENNARVDPDMSGNHTFWPTSFGKQIRGRNLRDAITKAMRGEK